MADIVYVVDDYWAQGYTLYTADAGASLASDFALAGTDLYWEADYSDYPYVISPVSGSFVSDGSASLASTVTVSADAGKISDAAAALESVDTFEVTVSAQKNFVADLSSTFTMAIDAAKIVEINNEIIAWDSQTAGWIDYIGDTWDGNTTGLILPGVFTLEASPRSNTDAYVDAHVVASVSTPGEYIAGGYSDQSSAFSLVVDADKFRQAASDISSEFTVVANGGRSVVAVSEQTSAATVTIAGVVTRDGAGALTSTATVSAEGYRTKEGAAALTSAGSELIVTAIVRGTGADITAVASVTVAGKSTRSGAAGLGAVASVSCSALQISAIRATVTATATMTVDGYRIQPGVSNLISNFSVTGLGGKLAEASAGLSVQGFELAVARVIHVPAATQLKVEYEERVLSVPDEERVIDVVFEDRVNIVTAETRDLPVYLEDRELLVS